MIILPYMVRQGEQQHVTEEYVSVPPALTVTDESGAIWTLGFRTGSAPRGEFAFNVLRNGVDTGEVASRIERRQGRVQIFTATGWKRLTVSGSREPSTYIYALGVRPVPAYPVSITLVRDPSHTPVARVWVGGAHGGVVDFRMTPLRLNHGRWVHAVVSSTSAGILIVAVVGEGLMRHVPIVVQQEGMDHA